MSHNKK